MKRPDRFSPGESRVKINRCLVKMCNAVSFGLVITLFGTILVAGCGEVDLPELIRDGAIDKDGNFSKLDPVTGSSESHQNQAVNGTIAHRNEPYRINYGDKLRLYFHGNSELSGDVVIRADGFCTFPRIGDLDAAGLELDDLSEEVKENYKNYYIDPDVTLSLVEESSGRFFVLGEVLKPGAYILEDGLTVLAGIASAGGFRSSAEPNSIVLVRSREPHPPESFRVDLSDVISGEDMEANPFIRASDIIYVPESFISKVDGFAEFLFGNFLPPVDSILRGYYFLNTVETRNRELELLEE